MNRRRRKKPKQKAAPLTSAIKRMDFAPVYGFLKNGAQQDQPFSGWNVLAHRPHWPSTAVVVMTRSEFDRMSSAAEAHYLATQEMGEE